MLLRTLLLIFLSSNLLGGGDPLKGKDLVSTCSACHGADGNSQVGLWPSLAGQNEKYLQGQLDQIKSGKRVIIEMTGLLDNLEKDDLSNIAAFYAAQANIVGQVSKDSIEAGSKLYYAGSLEKGIPACTACHSPNGSGNIQAGYPLLSGQKPEYLEKTLKEYRSGKRNGSEQALIMQSISSKLNDSEIKALANFIYGIY
jgi:cytochrome c553